MDSAEAADGLLPIQVDVEDSSMQVKPVSGDSVMPFEQEADDDVAEQPPTDSFVGLAPIDPLSDASATDDSMVDAEVAPARRRSGTDYLGRTFGGYELIDRIGAGGMGTVYKGYQKSLDREVAIKLLNPALVDNTEFIKRFEREAKSIAKISHPNIVSVLDFGQNDEDGVYYMVIEFVDGTSLAKLIAEKLVVPLEEFLPIIIQCLAGLQHVVMQGVIHRDIKPDNILIENSGVAKLADFGLAKDVNSQDTDLTAAGSAMGTPAYMSPEQCMGRPLDGRSDIYSLGVTAYLALTGEKPFTGKSSFEIMTKQREHHPTLVHLLNPRIDERVSGIIAKMLAKQPRDRYETADDCRMAWQDLGAELGIVARKGTDARMRSGIMVVPPELTSPEDIPAPEAMSPQLDPVTVSPREDSDVPGLPPVEPSMASFPAGAEPIASEPPAGGSPFDVPSDRHEQKDISSQIRRKSTRTSTRRRTSSVHGSWTCGSCGMLNSADHTTCERCHANRYSEEGEIDDSAKESQADSLLSAGEARRAAEIYAQLADGAEDRRQRSVLRSKEREARQRFADAHVEQVCSRAQTLADNGDIQGALAVIERGLREDLSEDRAERLHSFHATLQRRKGRGKRVVIWLLIMAVIIAGLAIALLPMMSPTEGASMSTEILCPKCGHIHTGDTDKNGWATCRSCGHLWKVQQPADEIADHALFDVKESGIKQMVELTEAPSLAVNSDDKITIKADDLLGGDSQSHLVNCALCGHGFQVPDGKKLKNYDALSVMLQWVMAQ